MPYEISVKEVPDQMVVSHKVEATLWTVGEEIGKGFGSMMQVVSEQGVSPTGPPFIVYHDMIVDESLGTIELCFPVAQPIDDSGDVKDAEIAGGPTATTMHKGSYSELATAYHALSTWISNHGHYPAGPPREVYLNDPNEVGQDDLLTEVSWPINSSAE